MTLLERLRSALAPDYAVREEIGRGGMGAVFLAADRALDRSVAVKVLRPELATARSVERFLREARAMAAVEHPRVLQVHRAGEAGGLYYYVMELARGETLADRLERRPLDPPELETLAEDLLDGLAAIHAAGIVHRDVKPSNIFLVDGRALVGDFGVALTGGDDDRLTAAGERVGTPRYLAPEQRDGEATSATDVYCAALVLYEACCGVPWRDAAGLDSAWDRVPRRLRGPLRRALNPDPAARWPDMSAFRSALGRRRPVPLWAALATAAAVAAAVLYFILGPPPTPRQSGGAVADLAVLPFQVVNGPGAGSGGGEPCDPEGVGCRLAQLVVVNLNGLPQLRVVPFAQTTRLEPAGTAPLEPEVLRALPSRYVAQGPIYQDGAEFELRLIVYDSLGQRQPEGIIRGPVSDPMGMADSIALVLVRKVLPRLASSFRGLEEETTASWDAMREYLLGEHSFQRNAWTLADRHYQQALAIDTAFALAKWRHWNTWRWQLTGEEVVDLDSLLIQHGDDLPAGERVLLEAEARAPGIERIQALEAASEEYGYVAFLHWLLADELHHRGPLIGRSLDEAVRQYREAGARNPYLGPVYEHSLLALIRLGREAEARQALDRMLDLNAGPSPDEEIYLPPLLHQAVLERFEPERAVPRRDSLFGLRDPEGLAALRATLEFAARMALLFDLPDTQLDLGRRLVGAGLNPSNGHTAQGLALMVMGRPLDALVHFDSAASSADSPSSRREAALEAAEMRVLLPALGVLDLPLPERERGRAGLRAAVVGPPTLALRAGWALALDACAAGELEAARRWRRSVAGEDGGAEPVRLATLVEACEAASLGQHHRVLALTEDLLRDQFLPRDRDPFTRTALHLLRATAYEALGREDASVLERRWSDNSDITERLGGRLQAVEVDWAASPYSDRRRARLAMEVGDTIAACRLLDRLDWLWTDVERQLEAARDLDRRLRMEHCP